jgi:hypothetical protein
VGQCNRVSLFFTGSRLAASASTTIFSPLAFSHPSHGDVEANAESHGVAKCDQLAVLHRCMSKLAGGTFIIVGDCETAFPGQQRANKRT